MALKKLCQKRQTSELLANGVKSPREYDHSLLKSLLSKIESISPEYKMSIDWETLLTTVVKNLHAVSHFKHETCPSLCNRLRHHLKESLKRITKSGGRGGEVLYASIFILPSARHGDVLS